MPELPEVETVRRRLAPKLVGRTIAQVYTSQPSYFFLTPPHRLRRALRGQTVESLERHGKYLIAHFVSGARLLMHLGMTGQLRVASPSIDSARLTDHTHLYLDFVDGNEAVFFRDVRKFGKVLFLNHGEDDARLAKLGPDALLTSPSILTEHLWRVSRKRRVNIKTLLLDQSVLAGVGNIYADEALFAAGIRPTRASSRLRRKENSLLTKALREILQRSIDSGGSTIRDYVSTDGNQGSAQNHHKVYGRESQPCTACQTPIQRVVLGARSTHFCRNCQR